MTIQDVIDEMMSRNDCPSDLFEAIGIPIEEWTEFCWRVQQKYDSEQTLAYLTSFCLLAGKMYGETHPLKVQ